MTADLLLSGLSPSWWRVMIPTPPIPGPRGIADADEPAQTRPSNIHGPVRAPGMRRRKIAPISS